MPKGGATSLTPVWAGLQDDLNDFLRAFLSLKSHRFLDYKNLFKCRGMINLFNGRNSSAEIIEFNELLLVYCLPYMDEFFTQNTKRSLEQRLFGLYSLYTFFYLQPQGHVVKIRMDTFAMASFHKLAQLVTEQNLWDASLCCSKLVKDKAIKVVAFTSVYDPSHFKKYRSSANLDGLPLVTDVNDPLSNCKELLKSDVFMGLEVAYEEYMRLKEKVGLPNIMPMSNPRELIDSIMKRNMQDGELQRGEVVKAKYVDLMTDQLMQFDRMAIKEKAYSSAVKQPNFRRQCHNSTKIVTTPKTFDFPKSDVESFTDFDDYNQDDKSIIEPIVTEKSVKIENKKRKRRASENKKKTTVVVKKEPAPEIVSSGSKSPGRRTNNSLASELFCFDGFTAAEQTPKKRNRSEKSEEKVKEATGTENPKVRDRRSKSVSFKVDNNGEIFVVEHQITPRTSFSEPEIREMKVRRESVTLLDSPVFEPESSEKNEGTNPFGMKIKKEIKQEIKQEILHDFEHQENLVDNDNNAHTTEEVNEWFVPLENEDLIREEEKDEAFDISLDSDLTDEE